MTITAPTQQAFPAIKFFKDSVEDILAGYKTLEPRPRTLAWIRRIERAGHASLTYGPRFGPPTIFATARITDITMRPFETATVEDLKRLGRDWRGESPERFVVEYVRWYANELAKGYPVAWISFEIVS
jgi:ASCH domain-containing protein